MQKEKTIVGADAVFTHKKENKGITLIALIITIIVMLILLGIIVSIALNGGLFKTAKEATEGTKIERNKELQLSSGRIEIDGTWYNSIKDYMNNKPALELPEGWTETTKPEGWSDKVTAITDGKNTIPLPEGYEISEEKEEQTVSEGLVITDGANEFVWIPVTGDFSNSYNYSSSYSEPTTVLDDTQENLTKYYGTKEDGITNYYTLGTDFDYNTHYSEMVTSVNKYDGFYIGRYETTIDENRNVGSKENTTVLTADKTLKEGTNEGEDLSGEAYYYRWWGLYYSQRNNSVKGNGEYVQTNMVWGQQWDAMIKFFGNKDFSGVPVKTLATSSSVVYSGQAKYIYENETISDEICNIYDLRKNAYEWTAESERSNYRVRCGR